MIDYRGLAALDAIIKGQSFDAAANQLNVTQSAISQRIKALEVLYGESVLIRSQPYKPTVLGESLLCHFQKVKLLEQGFKQQITKEHTIQQLSIAVSRDSLEIWFPAVIEQLDQLKHIQLQIKADDQELTLDYLRKGQVHACISTQAKALSGCQAHYIGNMDYVLVCSPAFKQTYFKGNLTKEKLLKAPAVIFDQHDYLHERFLAKYFSIFDQKPSFHVVPSIAGFRQFVLKSYGYALIPLLDIQHLLDNNTLCLVTKNHWAMPLYWHHWSLSNNDYKNFNQLIVSHAKKLLH